MNHADHVRLIRAGIHAPSGTWADFGAGHGTFTLALADLLDSSGTLYAIDHDAAALRANQRTLRSRFPAITAHHRVADFTQALDLPPLDGIIMANSLHFVHDKGPVLALVRAALKDTGRLILVEYNTDRGNRWVPYPMSYPTWEKLARAQGFAATRRLHTRPSSFLGEFFSAVSEKTASD